MYGLRDEAKKRGYSVDWDAATGNVKIGSQSYTPQMLQGLGGTNDGGSWKMSQQAINAMLGNAQPSYSQETQPYSNNAPVQYTPYEYKPFEQQAPDYSALFSNALSQYMREQPRLTEKAVDSVDTNMASRGLYRSGVRDSLATQAATDLEASLRQLAQQQAQSLYGQELNKYNTQLSAHNQMQQQLANQHNTGQQFANENYWQAQNQQLKQQDFENQLAQQQWARDMADRELEQQLRITQMNNAARSSGGAANKPTTQDPQRAQDMYTVIKEIRNYVDAEFSVPAKRNAYLDKQISDVELGVRTSKYTPEEGQLLITELQSLKQPIAQKTTYTPTMTLNPEDYGWGID